MAPFFISRGDFLGGEIRVLVSKGLLLAIIQNSDVPLTNHYKWYNQEQTSIYKWYY